TGENLRIIHQEAKACCPKSSMQPMSVKNDICSIFKQFVTDCSQQEAALDSETRAGCCSVGTVLNHRDGGKQGLVITEAENDEQRKADATND
ncbi:MAG: hypothetical protein II038_03390, partial [Lachnospiraceae bacterium]|nr:hypothetical protein [Lachnospiraceae bacterium]